jgi:ankyrin repeat protein
MRAEHMTRGGNDFFFVTGNYKVRTQARKEWLYVVGDENGQVVQPPASEMVHDLDDGHIVRRVIHPIDELLQRPLALSAKLTRVEMIAIVMYTGPVFVLYNAVLRRFPADIYSVFKDGDNLFPTTIFVLVSAINKLSRCMNIAPGTFLYRGLGGTMQFPDRFTRPDPNCTTPNALGYLEFGFMSTTANRSVAVQYSGVRDGRPRAGILQILPNSVDRGADISEFSQYPAEKEILFVPYSFVQGEGRQRTEVVDGGGVLTVVPVRVNINLKTETVEELMEKKKRLHLVSARAIVEELRYELQQWSTCTEALDRLQRDPSRNQGGTFTAVTLAAAIVKQCTTVVKRHEDAGAEEYVDDGVFRSLVNEMLETKAWALEKKNLWMSTASQFISFLESYSLRECHRLWLLFLQSSIANADALSSDRARDSVKLLMSRGLVKRAVMGETNADGEDLLVQAGADGWAVADINAAVDAGADLAVSGLDGCSGIWNAARYGHPASLRALYDARCDINKANNQGATPLYSASRAGHTACVKFLLSVKGDVNRCNNNGCSPIYAAAGNSHADCLALLLEAEGDLHSSDKRGESPVLVASRRGYHVCMKLLLDAKADMNTHDIDGCSPVCVAAHRNRINCLSILLEARADPRVSWKNASALEIARREGHAECVRLLEDAAA